jgi:hypothetical protein
MQTVDVGIKCACVVRRYDEIWAAQRDGTILIFRASTGERLHEIDNGTHMSLVWCMALVKRQVWAVRPFFLIHFRSACMHSLDPHVVTNSYITHAGNGDGEAADLQCLHP